MAVWLFLVCAVSLVVLVLIKTNTSPASSGVEMKMFDPDGKIVKVEGEAHYFPFVGARFEQAKEAFFQANPDLGMVMQTEQIVMLDPKGAREPVYRHQIMVQGYVLIVRPKETITNFTGRTHF